MPVVGGAPAVAAPEPEKLPEAKKRPGTGPLAPAFGF
jgi:hypothetical protein